MLEKKSIFCALLLISMMFVGCDPEPNSGDIGPRKKLYKTRADYSNNLAAQVTNDGSVYYVNNTFYIDTENDNDTIFNAGRIKLADGYILDRDGLFDFYDYHVVFLKLTFEEGYRIGHRLLWYVEDHLDSLILDSDPYVELYEDNTPDRFFGNYFWRTADSSQQQGYAYLHRDTAFLNAIIRNGEIEKYFKRLK